MFDTQTLTMECEMSEEWLKFFNDIPNIPDEIKQKIVDVYNYMAENNISGMEMRFESGMRIACQIYAEIDINKI